MAVRGPGSVQWLLADDQPVAIKDASRCQPAQLTNYANLT
jgi:hypothetical protein